MKYWCLQVALSQCKEKKNYRIDGWSGAAIKRLNLFSPALRMPEKGELLIATHERFWYSLLKLELTSFVYSASKC